MFQIMHLLKRRESGTTQLAQVKFETGLRNYESPKSFQAEKPWKYIHTMKVEKKDSPLKIDIPNKPRNFKVK